MDDTGAPLHIDAQCAAAERIELLIQAAPCYGTESTNTRLVSKNPMNLSKFKAKHLLE